MKAEGEKQMNHKQMIKYIEQQRMRAKAYKEADNIVDGYLLNSCLVLADKFGFGKKRLTLFLNYLAANTFNFADERLNGTETDRKMICDVLLNEYKFDFDKEVDDITEKRKKEIEGCLDIN